MVSVEKRISDLEVRTELLQTSGHPFSSSAAGLAEALIQGRLSVLRGEPLAETPITPEMMDDPLQGELYRLMHEARERVRNFR
jgi:hypothetical protein